ncbi:hypothetical protein PFISCL1PPCAC_10205, partial [Pristionchus fissidentatus]
RMSWASGINRLPDGTTVSIDEANHLMSVLLGEQSLSPTFSREVAMGVWNMWRIGIEEGWNENQMRERINEKRNALTESLSTVFKSRLADLRKHFSSIRYADPTVIDSEWVVSREKESGSSGVSGRNGAVSCEFTLKSIAAGEFDTKELKLNMNKMELQVNREKRGTVDEESRCRTCTGRSNKHRM